MPTYHVTIRETVESVVTLFDCNDEEEARTWILIGKYGRVHQTEPESVGDVEIIDVAKSEE